MLSSIDGKPLVIDGKPVTTTTDSEGKFSFTGLKSGDYKVKAIDERSVADEQKYFFFVQDLPVKSKTQKVSINGIIQ